MGFIMLVKFIVFFFIAFCFVTLNAQNSKESIIVENHFWGNRYFINYLEYSRSDIYDKLESDPETRELVRSSTTKKTWGYITLPVGLYITLGGLSGIYTEKNNYGPNANLSPHILKTALGVVLEIVAIMLFSDSKSDFRSAINLHNKNIKDSDKTENYQLELNYGLNGISLSLRF
jgi:hypothetical protein